VRGGALPPALLCAALGFALAFAPRRAWLAALFALVLVATAASFVPPPLAWRDPAFIGCWATIVVTALCVHLPKGVGPRLALLLGANTGLWTGAVIAVAGVRRDLLESLPLALLCLPGGWLVATGRGIAIKVVASWLIAVALLSAGLTLVPTPGYVPDHMD
jgi:hypothetical protein